MGRPGSQGSGKNPAQSVREAPKRKVLKGLKKGYFLCLLCFLLNNNIQKLTKEINEKERENKTLNKREEIEKSFYSTQSVFLQ
jgi:hypothetical protein